MSSPLRIDLRPSIALTIALWSLAGLAVVALLRSEVPIWVGLVVPILLVAALRRLRPGHAHALVFRSDGSAVAMPAAGAEIDIQPLQLQCRGPLTVVVVRMASRRARWCFMSDTLSFEDRRRLTLWFERYADRDPGAKARVAHV